MGATSQIKDITLTGKDDGQSLSITLDDGKYLELWGDGHVQVWENDPQIASVGPKLLVREYNLFEEAAALQQA